MRRTIADPRVRRPLLALVLLMAATVFAVAQATPTRTTAAGETPPPAPPDAPADAQYSTVSRGSVVTVTFPSRVLTNARGEVVDLGGVHSCGSFGCFAWGISWNFGYYGFPHEVIQGCTSTDWSCTFRYLDGTPTGSGAWSRLDAALGYTRLAEGGIRTYYFWAPATHASVRVRGVFNGSPVAPFNETAFLVRAGASATFADCATTNRSEPPADSTCIPMWDYGDDFSAIVPLGSGPWVVYGYLTGTSGLIANSPKRQFSFTNPPGTFGNANIVAVTGDLVVDLPYIGPGGSTTTAPTTTLPPGATTTTSSIPGVGGGNTPPPPVVTAATAGAPGNVSGTIAGRPGATVHVTIAHHSGTSCARQMSGTGVTTVGAVNVVIEADGESPFTLPGTVPTGGWLYGTADNSTVGDCFAVPVPQALTAAPLVPARVLETRPGGSTADDQFAGVGRRDAGSVTELPIAGRAGVPANASAVVLNVTVTEPQAAGYLTVWPCGEPQPTASNLNYAAGQTVANLVIAKLGASGSVCLYTQQAADVVADVNGFFPPAASFAPLVPARLLDTRAGASTVDGGFAGMGTRDVASVTELVVGGRGGVPDSAAAVVLNVTVTNPQGAGYLTVWPCGEAQPTASNLNYTAGQTVPNAVITKVGEGGKVCIFTQQAADIVADVNGFFPAGTTYASIVPARVLETRADGSTVDGRYNAIGAREASSVTELVVGGRAGVPVTASAVALNVTVTNPQGAGYLTVWPCGEPQPTASNLNYIAGQTVPNLVLTKVGPGGKVCIFTQQAADILADVAGYFPPVAG